jgi:hypothetical protein
VLDEIERLGGIEAYLRLAGVPREELMRLRRRATQP